MVKKIKVKNFDIPYKTFGEGPVSVFIHGFGGGPSDWFGFIDAFPNEQKMVVLNLRPIYNSLKGVPFGEQSQLLGEAIKAILKEINYEGAINLVGTSYGATLALSLKSNSDLIIEKNILVNPMPAFTLKKFKNPLLKIMFFLSQYPKGLYFFVRTKPGRKMMIYLSQLFRIRFDPDRKNKQYYLRKILIIQKSVERFMWLIKGCDWKAYLKTLKDDREHIIIYGDADQLFTEDTYMGMTSNFIKIVSEKIPNGDHFMIRTRHEEVVEIVIKFMDDDDDNFSKAG